MADSKYPKWKYHLEYESLVVQTAEQEKILGAEWKDSPSEFGKETASSTPSPLKPKLKVQK